MRTLLISAALLAAAGLSGCVGMSRSEAVAPIALDVARDARVDQIVLTRAPSLRVSREFDAIFQRHVAAELAKCAKGPRPLRLEARVDRLSKTPTLITAVVAGANVLRGSARLVDQATGQTVGEYKIGKTVVGGRFGAIMMAQAEEQMSDGFGQELCAKAFSGEGG